MNRLLWPGAVFLLIGSIIVVDITMLIIASNDPAFAVDPSYDASTRTDLRSDIRPFDSLGFVSSCTVLPGQDAHSCYFKMSDTSGATIDDAAVRLTAYHNARRAQSQTFEMQIQDNGTFLAKLPVQRPGLWKFEFLVNHEGKEFALVEERMLGSGSTK